MYWQLIWPGNSLAMLKVSTALSLSSQVYMNCSLAISASTGFGVTSNPVPCADCFLALRAALISFFALSCLTVFFGCILSVGPDPFPRELSNPKR